MMTVDGPSQMEGVPFQLANTFLLVLSFEYLMAIVPLSFIVVIAYPTFHSTSPKLPANRPPWKNVFTFSLISLLPSVPPEAKCIIYKQYQKGVAKRPHFNRKVNTSTANQDCFPLESIPHSEHTARPCNWVQSEPLNRLPLTVRKVWPSCRLKSFLPVTWNRLLCPPETLRQSATEQNYNARASQHYS